MADNPYADRFDFIHQSFGISTLASDAAVAIDNRKLKRDKHINSKPLKTLAQLLEEFLAEPNPLAITCLSNVVSRCRKYVGEGRVPAIMEKLPEIARNLRKIISGDCTSEQIAYLTDFCLQLSREASGFSIYWGSRRYLAA